MRDRLRIGRPAADAGGWLARIRGLSRAGEGEGGGWSEDAPPGARLAAWLARQVAVEAAHRSSFHILPVGLIVGTVAVDALDWRPNPFAACAAALTLALLGQRVAARPALRALLFFLALSLVGALFSIAEAEGTPTTVISGTATTRIAGRVLSATRDDKGRMRYLVAISGTVRPVLSRPPERVRILVSARHRPKAPGDAFYGLVRLGPPSGPAAPGMHDFAYQPFFEGVGAIGFALGRPDEEPASGLAPPPAPGPIGDLAIRLEGLRGAMTGRIEEAAGGGEAGAIAAALVTGERTGIPDEAETWLRGVGLAHVLSISGLHLAIVAGSVLLLIRSALALLPALSLNYPVKKIAALAALSVAAFYLVLSGSNVATGRAFVMLAVMLSAVLVDRPALTLRNVSIAALVVVLAAPHVVTTASFQMSFAATLALVAGYGAFMRRRGRGPPPTSRSRTAGALRFLGGTFLAIAASSIIGGAATAPFAAYHFHRVAPFGLVANVLTLPIFTFLVMPLGLVGTLLMPFGLDAWCFRLMGLAIRLVLIISEWLYDTLPDRGTGPIDGSGVVLLSAALLAASLFASRFRLVAVPLLVAGLLTIRDASPPPQLVVYEDGKTLAAFGPDGAITYPLGRRNGFVAGQWERSAAIGAADKSVGNAAGEAPGAAGTAAADDAGGSGQFRPPAAPCRADFCRFETRDGLKVAWTSDYRLTGDACDGGDVAIVARAIRLEACRSGAVLVTLRTLRETGSIAIARKDGDGRPVVTPSIPPDPQPWNRHRLAPWPEYWKKPSQTDAREGRAEPLQRGDAPAAP
ncbi:ComEC/Rec2 family competence protein [Jiella sonneratiae]|uniref:ComEC/Rec2 family competence protein n=1 Tax=Jiella sonneratiae TaxID=2816856 RepID=A0ABS3J5W6_9HYPH|nr:ComEC/Rec2 family competence protein [Jiella sonneratiae]MBO0905037.1 ComEC/Rec2 family competence protein [Jiella sonneratiae]